MTIFKFTSNKESGIHTEVAHITRNNPPRNSSSVVFLSSKLSPAWCTPIPQFANSVRLIRHRLTGGDRYLTFKFLVMKMVVGPDGSTVKNGKDPKINLAHCFGGDHGVVCRVATDCS